MGMCSYCYCHKREHDECFSWREAKVHCGISGPDDPKRVEAKAYEESLSEDDKKSRAEHARFMRNYQQ